MLYLFKVVELRGLNLTKGLLLNIEVEFGMNTDDAE
jgi:hypothetical protein